MGSKVETHLLIGSYAAADQESIFQYAFNTVDGKLSLLNSIGGIENPSFIVPSENRQLLFAISEKKKGDYSAMATFRMIPGTKPTLISEVTYKGSGACHITVDRERKFAISANYVGGSLTLLPFEEGENCMIQYNSWNLAAQGRFKSGRKHRMCTVRFW